MYVNNCLSYLIHVTLSNWGRGLHGNNCRSSPHACDTEQLGKGDALVGIQCNCCGIGLFFFLSQNRFSWRIDSWDIDPE